jgi:hypothetical protein
MRVVDTRDMSLAAPIYERALKACLRAGAELRSQSRVAVDMQATIVLGSRGVAHPQTVTLRDLSPAGVGFTSNVAIAVDEWVVIHLPLSETDSLPLLINIRHCRATGESQFTVGAKFIDDPLGGRSPGTE